MTTLVIMAAGIGSRYGGIKQLDGIDSHGHLIIDYSVHDAIKAGFNKIVFVIRKEIEADFNKRIGNRIKAVCGSCEVETACVFQELQDIPGELPEGRTKPWGTGHAVLSAAGEIDGPFAVINADDYYGTKAFRMIHDWLEEEHGQNEYCLAGFILKNTLSENGGVTRGVCQVDGDGWLTSILETHNIRRTESGVVGDEMDPELLAPVSMNMWGLQKEFLPLLKEGFEEFLQEEMHKDPLKKEFLIPSFIGELLEEKKARVKVLDTDDKWFGVTYREDHDVVVEGIRRLVESGEYSEDLYEDL